MRQVEAPETVPEDRQMTHMDWLEASSPHRIWRGIAGSQGIQRNSRTARAGPVVNYRNIRGRERRRVDLSPAPLRITLGSDAYGAIDKSLTDRLAVLHSQRELARSTDAPLKMNAGQPGVA